MNATQLELTRLIGKKELTFGCLVQTNTKFMGETRGGIGMIAGRSPTGKNSYYVQFGTIKVKDSLFVQSYYKDLQEGLGVCNRWSSKYITIIGHPATLTDLHRWMNEKRIYFKMLPNVIWYWDKTVEKDRDIEYDSSKYLLDQEEETLKQIVELIKENK